MASKALERSTARARERDSGRAWLNPAAIVWATGSKAVVVE